jgi:hypothetical protein
MVAQRSSTEPDRAQRTATSPPDDERAAFLDALVQTMQSTLAAQKAKLAEDIERRRMAHVDAISARRELEAGRMREHADEDRRAINRWAADERTRIQFERERRTHELQRELDSKLAEHSLRIEQEIEKAEAVIAAHRAEVDGYFDALQRETDPVAIAQQALKRPRFPTIERSVQAVVSASPRVGEPESPAADAADSPAAEELVVAEAATVATPEPETSAALAIVDPTEPLTAQAAQQSEAEAVDEAAETPAAESPGVPVMDTIAERRARWWATWKDLPEPPVLMPVGQSEPTPDLIEAARRRSPKR